MLKFKKVAALICFLLVLMYLSCLQVFAQPVQSLSQIKNNVDGSQVLLNHVPREVAQGIAVKTAHAASSQMLNLRIVLPSKDQAGIDALLKQLYDPKNPNFHKFLTHTQVIQKYGANSTDAILVKEQLKSMGLTVTGQSDDGRILKVSGPVSAIENAFKLNINNYRRPDGTAFYAPDANPTIPTLVAGKITAIVGLDNGRRFHSHFHKSKIPLSIASSKNSSIQNSANIKALKLLTPKFSGYGGTVAPSDLVTAYNMNSISSTGTGQTLALVELDGYISSDITEYLGQFGMSYNTSNITVVPINGGVSTLGDGQGEVELDIDVALGMAPGLTGIHVYEDSLLDAETGNGWFDLWDAIATSNTDKVVSSSWGSYETPSGGQLHGILQTMAMQGQSVFAAAGDAGAYDECATGALPPFCSDPSNDTPCCTSPQNTILVVDDPASDPYVTSVGISNLTVVNPGETYSSEAASLYGGGGISQLWTIPTYQTTAASQAAPAAQVSQTMRNVPDVVLTADPATLYPIYISGVLYGVWGSSAAAPIWAAYMTRVNQGRGSLGPVGWLNPQLYQIFISNQVACLANANNCDFHDLVAPGTNSYYHAEVGYDDASGLGSMNGANLYTVLTGPGAPTGLTAVPGNASVALSWNTVTGATSYNVQRSTTNGGPYTLVSNVNAITFTDNSTTDVSSPPVNGTTYYYVVSALNGSGVGLNSAQVTVIPGTPAAPTAVTAVAGNNQAAVSFTPGANNGAAIIQFSATSTPGNLVGIGTLSPVTVSGLTNGDSYLFSVTAQNANGTGPASAASNVVVPAGPPLAPTNVSAVAGNMQATVSFTPGSNNGSAIGIFTVTSNTGGHSNTGTSSPITVSGLTNFSPYSFTVTATNGVGTSSASSASNTITPVPIAPPTSLKASLLGAKIGSKIIYGGVVLTWWQSPTAGVTQNKIYRSTNSGGYTALATINAATTYADKSMAKGVVYNYYVTALNSGQAESPDSNTVSVNY